MQNGDLSESFPLQADRIPTMSVGIPGDAVMARLLGSVDGPGNRARPVTEFSPPPGVPGSDRQFWLDNIMLLLFNIPVTTVSGRLRLALPVDISIPSCSSCKSAPDDDVSIPAKSVG